MDQVTPEQLKKSVQDQSSVRVKLGVPVALATIAVNLFSQSAAEASFSGISVLAGYIFYALATYVVARHPGPLSWRHIAIGTAVLDPAILSAWLYFEGEAAILIVGFYLFTILGFGFRIGPKIMRFCQAISIGCFGLVLMGSPIWRDNLFFGLSHLILLLIVPMYAGSLMRDLRAAKAYAERESKAKTQLLANVSHELRTPLTGIVSAAQLLDSESNTPEANRLAATILKLASSLDAEISQLLDLSKLGIQPADGPPVPYELGTVIHTIEVALTETAAAKGVELKTEISPDIVRPVLGHPHELTSILMNLAGNAVKFTHTGTVTIQINLKAANERTYSLSFVVTDTGIGIPLEHQEKLFEPFYRIETGDRRQYRGTGLGTTIAREHVRRMGGELLVSSTPGEGSTFWFEIELPIASLPVVPVDNQAPPILAPKRILVADDNALNLELLQQMLARDGHLVTAAHNGNDALSQLALEDFDVVMLDFNMDDLDGLSVFQTYAMGRLHPAPTFFVTADTSSSTAAKLSKAGAAGVVYKPLTFDKLRGAIASVFPNETPTARPEVADRDGARLSVVPVEHIDPAILDLLREIKDQPEFLHKIIGDGIADLRDLLSQLSDAITHRDLHLVHHRAHAMRGVALNIGAVRLGAQCERLMDIPMDQLSASSERLNDDLVSTWKEALQALEELRAPFAGPAQPPA
ncbi:ATP-binding protein [Lysobacter capsici]|nr:ATP-binding protein [Lysobacter capsici]